MPDGSTAAPAMAFASAPGTGLTHYAAGAGVGQNVGLVLGTPRSAPRLGRRRDHEPERARAEHRPHVVNAQPTWGYLNTAVGLSVVTNSGPNHQAQVMGGFTSLVGPGGPANMRAATASPPISRITARRCRSTLDNCSFTATTLVPAAPLTATQLGMLKRTC